MKRSRVLMNENLSTQVDREERPDLIRSYDMRCDADGSGGWPMTSFSARRRSLYGGTYFRPSSYNMPVPRASDGRRGGLSHEAGDGKQTAVQMLASAAYGAERESSEMPSLEILDEVPARLRAGMIKGTEALGARRSSPPR